MLARYMTYRIVFLVDTRGRLYLFFCLLQSYKLFLSLSVSKKPHKQNKKPPKHIADFIKTTKKRRISLIRVFEPIPGRRVREERERESLNQRAYYLNDGLLYADLALSGKPLLHNIVIIENVLYD